MQLEAGDFSGRGRDRYDRLISVCQAGETNLNAAMVGAGMALAYRRYSRDYVPQEARAPPIN